MTRDCLQFLRSGRVVRLNEFLPRTTVLDWLRESERSIGTKEGCAEGDCGACATVVVREHGGRLVYEPVNSCITLLGQLDGAELITVEDLADDGELHPVQEAMARQHGSQCGFCTPGIVMSLFAHYHACNGATTREAINDALAGNLCRCTGYRPIVDAALEACAEAADDRFTRERRRAAAGAAVRSTTRPISSSGMMASFFAAPASEQSPGATLRATSRRDDRRRRDRCRPVDHQEARADREGHPCRPRRRAFLDRGDERGLCDRRDRFTGARRAGAGIDRSRYRRSAAAVRLDPGARLRHGRRQYRQRLADRRSRADADRAGSFAGVASRRSRFAHLPLENFFLDYGKQDRQPGEFVRRLLVPKLCTGHAFSRLQDHQALRRGYFRGARRILPEGRRRPDQRSEGRLRRHGGNSEAREGRRRGTARPVACRQRSGWQAAADAVGKDFTPLTDLRASAAYRMRVAGNLVIKALAEIAGVSSDIDAHRRIAGWSPMPPNDAVSEAPLRHVYKALPHDSGAKHVQGAAEYIDDIPEPAGTLHVAVGGSPVARGTHPRIDLAEVHKRAGRRRRRHRGGHTGQRTTFRRRMPMSRCLRRTASIFHGQPVFAVVATSRDAARRAAPARRVRDRCGAPERFRRAGQSRPASACCPITPSSTAMPPRRSRRRRCAVPARSTSAARNTFIWKARSRSPCPGEDGAMLVYSSTQHPSEVQHIVARVLGAAGFVRDLPRAPHGRRLRRQGDAGDAVGGALPRSPRARPAGPASSGSTATPTWS